jgi:DNA replication and repair protein RecF
VLVTGPNGAGKTNLLESLHVGTQGFSPRTRTDAQLVRFGQDAARVALRGDRAGVGIELEVTLELGSGKRAAVNGARLRAAEQLRSEVTTLVFTPDRLVVVKGGPAARRAYFDRVFGRLTPARAGLSAEYGAAVGQRNAALRRVAQGVSSREALAPWNEQVSRLATDLVAGRHETVAALQPRFAERAGELGLPRAELRYEGEAPTAAQLEERVDRDLERGATGAGPHLDDLGVLSADRDLRTFGSQGEQRLAVLALLLGEAELLEERRGTRPLLLLDDVLSELDGGRRRILADRLRASGQALVTSASRSALPGAPSQLLEVAQSDEGTSEVRAG